MEAATQEEYRLILTDEQMPTTDEARQAALAEAARVMAENTDLDSTRQFTLRAIAIANANQLMDRAVDPTAIQTVRKSLGALTGVIAG